MSTIARTMTQNQGYYQNNNQQNQGYYQNNDQQNQGYSQNNVAQNQEKSDENSKEAAGHSQPQSDLITCHYCNGPNHIQRNCYLKWTQQQQRYQRGSSNFNHSYRGNQV